MDLIAVSRMAAIRWITEHCPVQATGKGMMLLKTGVLALASGGLYYAFFAHEAAVTRYYTMGGFYAALPILTALAFAVIHGAFASQCLETLGITAKTTVKKQVSAAGEYQPTQK